MSRRRIQLGSGLDRRKLADTIAQLSGEQSQEVALICDVPGNPNAWAHLTPQRSTSSSGAIEHWALMAGYPSELAPNSYLPQMLTLPAGTQVDRWLPGIYVRLIIDSAVDPHELSAAIEQLMIEIQGVTSRSQVEIALETE